MPAYDQKTFNDFALTHKVPGFFPQPIKLRSGRDSNWYLNWRTVSEDAFLTGILGEYILSFARQNKLNPDTFYGVPEGATKIGLIAQFLMAQEDPLVKRAFAMGRGKQKEHGAPKDRYFLGLPKGRTVILEDVTTTGGSLLTTLDQLVEAQVEVIAAITLTNRMEKRGDGLSVEEALRQRGVPFFAMSNALELLPLAYARLQPGREIGLAIEREFEEVGVQRLKLVSP